jgi:uncharacterized protein YegP (UPF0339 family)
MSKFFITHVGDSSYYLELETSGGEIVFTSKNFKSIDECNRTVFK